MVAAHASDTRGAKAVGMKTIYVYRATDDILEDQEVVKGENDAYLEDGMLRLGDVVTFLDTGAMLMTAEEKARELGSVLSFYRCYFAFCLCVSVVSWYPRPVRSPPPSEQGFFPD